MNGIKDMTSMIVIVFAAYMVRNSLIAIGLPEYVVAVARPFMSPELLPLITFIACTILTFASGSNWGATLAVAAIVIPLCAALQGNSDFGAGGHCFGRRVWRACVLLL